MSCARHIISCARRIISCARLNYHFSSLCSASVPVLTRSTITIESVCREFPSLLQRRDRLPDTWFACIWVTEIRKVWALWYPYYSTIVIKAAVIILRYIPGYVTMVYEKWYTSLLLTPCIWSSKSCRLHVDFTFQLSCWPCIFCITMLEIKKKRGATIAPNAIF